MENPVKEGSMTWELAYLKLRQQNLEAEKEIQLLKNEIEKLQFNQELSSLVRSAHSSANKPLSYGSKISSFPDLGSTRLYSNPKRLFEGSLASPGHSPRLYQQSPTDYPQPSSRVVNVKSYLTHSASHSKLSLSKRKHEDAYGLYKSPSSRLKSPGRSTNLLESFESQLDSRVDNFRLKLNEEIAEHQRSSPLRKLMHSPTMKKLNQFSSAENLSTRDFSTTLYARSKSPKVQTSVGRTVFGDETRFETDLKKAYEPSAGREKVTASTTLLQSRRTQLGETEPEKFSLRKGDEIGIKAQSVREDFKNEMETLKKESLRKSGRLNEEQRTPNNNLSPFFSPLKASDLKVHTKSSEKDPRSEDTDLKYHKFIKASATPLMDDLLSSQKRGGERFDRSSRFHYGEENN